MTEAELNEEEISGIERRKMRGAIRFGIDEWQSLS